MRKITHTILMTAMLLLGMNFGFAQNEFITTWQTTTAGESITIPTTGTGYDYTVDWGDGIVENNFTGDATHIYATAGTHTVSITGDFPRIYFNNGGDKDKIMTIEQWGNIVWQDMSLAFFGCSKLTYNAIDTPNLSNVTTLYAMFFQASLFNGDIGSWDVSNVTNMQSLFGETSFDQDISGWDVSNVTNLSQAFFNTPFNQDISNWNVGSVSNMQNLFLNAASFNQDISGWDISSVTNMTSMFNGSNISSINYDKILQGWAAQTVQPNVPLGAAGINYCNGSAARSTLTSGPNNWVITDGGESCIIDIPDANFKAALLGDATINTVDDGEITVQEAEAYTGALDVSGLSIADLSGIEYFINITSFYFNDNDVTNLDLSNNHELTIVQGYNNELTSINLNGCSKITSLNLTNSSLTTINLSDLVLLNTAYLVGNDLTSIDLSANVVLRVLSIQANGLTSLDLTNNNDLEWLYAQDNSLVSLDLSNNTALTIAFLGNNSLSTLNVSNNTALTDLRIMNNNLSTIDISANSNLENFFAHGNLPLTQLNAKNGAYTIINAFDITNNPNLTCVLVDNPNYSKDNWTLVDDNSVYKLTCNPNDIVNIPDANFKAALLANTAINSTDDGEITYGEAEAATEIDVNSQSIADFTGLEAFYNLTTFWGVANTATSIDVSNLTELELLFLYNTPLSSLDVSNNSKLTSLQFGGNTTFNSIDLSNNIELYEISAPNTNSLTTITGIENLPLLNYLYVQGCNIETLDLRFNPVISQVRVHNNNLSFLDIRNGNNAGINIFETQNNPGLACISVDDPIYSKTTWTNVDDPDVFKFSCDPDDIVNIPDANFKAALLSNASINTTDDGEITYGEAEAWTGSINVNSLSISDLTGIEAFANITELHCSGNNLTEIDVRYNTELSTYLILSNNNIGSIDLSANTKLRNLQVSNCGLSGGIDLSALTQLLALTIRSNGLTSIDVSNNVALIDLGVEFNDLSVLDVSSNTALQQLRVANNPLTDLDVSANTNLTILYADNCQIQDLDVSGNPALHTLSVIHGSLSSLNVANGNNSNFINLSVRNHADLFCITVDDIGFAETNFTDIPEVANFSTNCSNTATDFLTFEMPQQAGPATINVASHTVIIEVPIGTDITSLVPSFTISNGSSVDIPSGLARDFSSNMTYTITAENPTVYQEWTVIVQEENVAPTDIILGNTSIDENNSMSATIGIFSTADDNTGSTHTYSLVAGTGDTDNDSFIIAGNQLRAAVIFDFESQTSYSILVQTNDGRGGLFTKSFAIAINDLSNLAQTISLPELEPKTFGDPDFDLEATGGESGNAVLFASSDESVAIIEGSTVKIVGAGETTITASQSGNEDYAATDLSRELLVNKAEQTLSFGLLAPATYGDTPFELSALADSGLDVVFSSSDETIARIEGNLVTITGAGTVTITASQSGSSNYLPATPIDQDLTIDQANQTITFEPIGDKVTTDSDFDVEVSSTSGLEVSLEVEGPASISGATVSLNGTPGTVTITASQVGDENYFAAMDVSVSFEVASAAEAQTITFDEIEDQILETGGLSLSATASSGLEVTFELVGGPVQLTGNEITFEGLGTVTIQASQPGNEFFLPAEPVEQSFEIVTVTSVDEWSSVLSIFPNPVSDFLNIAFPESMAGDIVLVNQQGQVVVRANRSDRVLDLRQLERGIYVVRIQTENEIILHKIIKN